MNITQKRGKYFLLRSIVITLVYFVQANQNVSRLIKLDRLTTYFYKKPT